MRGMLRSAAVLAGTVGGLSGAAYGMLIRQTRSAQRVLEIPGWMPLRADGVYLPDASGPVPPSELFADVDVLTLAVLGDSSAAGLGVDTPDQLPGVLLARGLAEESGRPVQLDTHAISGSTSQRLAGQLDTALVNPPDAALIMVGANDVKVRILPSTSAALLGAAVASLRAAGAAVVVGTCPDLGAIRPIPQPLRSVVRSWSLTLARLQREAVLRAGGHPVALADLLTPEFLAQPDALFSRDRLHPSAAGYEATCSVLLPALCSALGVWGGGPPPHAPVRSAPTDARRWTTRITASADRGLRRVTGYVAGVRP
ncbi:MAG: SGNH/GDSL hydrolase family protein [Pseudonocardiaceae bacterium]